MRRKWRISSACRNEADRGLGLRRWHRQHELLDLQYGRVGRIRDRSRIITAETRLEARPEKTSDGQVHVGLDAGVKAGAARFKVSAA